jgi:hypothetical protein
VPHRGSSVSRNETKSSAIDVIASAILDRLLRQSIGIKVKGRRFRFKEKLKAGPLKSKNSTPVGRMN